MATVPQVPCEEFRNKLRAKEKALEIARSLEQEPRQFQVAVVRELEGLFLEPWPEVSR